jgi:isocitrate/isopropylmalate dehydrogenase
VVPNSVAESIKLITAAASYRVANYAFSYAKEHKRKRVTAVHKANIMYAEKRKKSRLAFGFAHRFFFFFPFASSL